MRKRCPAVSESRDFGKEGLRRRVGGSGAVSVAGDSAAFTWPCKYDLLMFLNGLYRASPPSPPLLSYSPTRPLRLRKLTP